MKRIAFPCLCLLLLAVTSCQREAAVRSALARAEAVMETDPNAARLILDSLSHEIVNHPNRQSIVNRKSSNRQSNLALWALLKTQADYKCRIRLTSDSLPLIATNYYGTRHKTQYAALSQHYLGCTYRDMGRDLDAIDALLRATTLFPDTTNKYFANSLFELGLLYSKHNMEYDAMKAFGRYRKTEICNSDSVNIGYADYYLGSCAAYIGNNLLADSLLKCVINNTRNSEDIRYDSYLQLAKLYYYHWHNLEKASDYVDKHIGFFEGKRSMTSALLLKGDIQYEKKEPERAYENYKKTLERSKDIYTQCLVYKGLAKVSPLLNMPDSTDCYIEQYSMLVDSIYSLSRQKEISDIENNHVIEIHDQQMKARHVRFLLLGGLSLLFAFSAFIISLLLIDRKRKNEKLQFEQKLRDIKQRHIDQNIKEEEPETEEENPNDSESEIDETESPVTPSPSPHLSIQQERVTLYRTQFADSRWNRYLEERKVDILSKKYMPKEDASSFRDYLQDLFADVFLDMVNENANVTRPDLEYCAMKLLGFSTAYIAYCAQVSFHSLHNRRYHIKDKLTPDWYTFIFGTP